MVHIGQSPRKKNIREPCAGEPHARFDEGEQGSGSGHDGMADEALDSERARNRLAEYTFRVWGAVNLFSTLHHATYAAFWHCRLAQLERGCISGGVLGRVGVLRRLAVHIWNLRGGSNGGEV
jgi:hypothetical protein